MKILSPDARKDMMMRKETLEKARRQLKREFIGIEKPIDDIIESFGYWYFFPEIQTRPVIINLWGLTGVGKTSLVTRLMELTGMQKRFYRFNLSENEWDIRSILADIYENRTEGGDMVMLLDEFQYVRTISETGEEKTTRHQFIWDLLDSGRIPIVNYHMRLSELTDLTLRLSKLLQLGVQVKEGLVVEGHTIFRQELGEVSTLDRIRRRNTKQSSSELNFVPPYYQEVIYELDRVSFALQSEVMETLKGMNGPETITFLRKVIRHGLASRHIDCTRSLVFIIGNLDEAYGMAGNFDTDIDADDFHSESLKISLPVIKEALRKRFRSEQIARLGNNHIIYPALSSDSYRKIIELELSRIRRSFHSETGLRLSFASSLNSLIYDEGVFPTQGTRPLLSTIHNLVNSQLPKVLFTILDKAPSANGVQICYHEGKLLFRLFARLTLLLDFSEEVSLSLENLRKCTNDDMQAISAVHESGHAVVSVALLRIVPEIVCSVTTSPDNKGFIFSKNDNDYIAKREIPGRVAMLLGGYAAEKIVFGEENITTGATSDISQATHLVCSMLKSCGMDGEAVSFHVEDPVSRYFVYDSDNGVNNRARQLIADALVLAEKTLAENYSLLLEMSKYLSINRAIRKEEIISMVESVCGQTGICDGLRDGPPSYYRNRLSELIREGNSMQPADKTRKGEFGYSLNMD